MAEIGRHANETGWIANLVEDLRSGDWIKFDCGGRMSRSKKAGISHTAREEFKGAAFTIVEVHFERDNGFIVAFNPEDKFGGMVYPPKFVAYQSGDPRKDSLKMISEMEVVEPNEP